MRNGFSVEDKRTYQADPHFELRSVMGEYLLVPLSDADIQPGTMLLLNETGSILWQMLKVPRSFQDLLDSLRAEYTDTDGSMEDSVRAFLEDMQKKGLVRTVSC